jgi:hypothetical protein
MESFTGVTLEIVPKQPFIGNIIGNDSAGFKIANRATWLAQNDGDHKKKSKSKDQCFIFFSEKWTSWTKSGKLKCRF